MGLDVSLTGTIEADPDGDWRVELPTPPAPHGVWIATQTRSVWVRHDDGCDELFPGEVLLISSGSAAAPVEVATSPDATNPPGDPAADPVFALLGVRPVSGVVFGTLALGPLEDEVLGLPPVHIARRSTGVANVTLRLLEQLTAPGTRPAIDQAIARAVVIAALECWLPRFLRDNSLRRSIEFILAAETPPKLEAVPLPRRCSPRTMHRRFRETTGRAPGDFVRWWTAVRARAALHRGATEHEVAALLGYRHVRSLRRLLDRF